MWFFFALLRACLSGFVICLASKLSSQWGFSLCMLVYYHYWVSSKWFEREREKKKKRKKWKGLEGVC